MKKKLNSGTQIIEFRRLGLDHGRIDRENGVIYDVSLITSGIEARGHDLHTDDTTLGQVCALMTEMGQVPVKWNHKTGADSVNGYVSNARVIGDKTKADWHLLKSHPSFNHAIELAERMPQNVGLSVAFVGAPPATVNGKKFARVEELVSVDLVAQPAANPGGLFEAASGLVDTSIGGNMNQPDPNTAAGTQNAEPTLADLLEAIKGQNETIAGMQQQMQGLVSSSREGQGLSVEELQQIAQLDDAELAKLDLTREEVDSAVAEAMSGVDDDGDEQEDHGDGPVQVFRGDPNRVQAARGGGAAQIAASNAARGAGAGVQGGEVMAELSDLRRRVTHFERQATLEKQQEEAEALQEFFNSIEEKVQYLEARNQALETAFEAGGGSVSANGEFTMPAGVLPDGSRQRGRHTEFEELVQQKIVELQTADSKLHPATARRMAVQFVQGGNRAAYTKHLEAKGVQLEIL